MVTLKKGAVKFKSIKAAYESAKKRNPDLKYITFYARVKAKEAKLGLGWAVSEAYHKPVRRWSRRSGADQQVAA